jgi:hypothetical protein
VEAARRVKNEHGPRVRPPARLVRPRASIYVRLSLRTADYQGLGRLGAAPAEVLHKGWHRAAAGRVQTNPDALLGTTSASATCVRKQRTAGVMRRGRGLVATRVCVRARFLSQRTKRRKKRQFARTVQSSRVCRASSLARPEDSSLSEAAASRPLCSAQAYSPSLLPGSPLPSSR